MKKIIDDLFAQQEECKLKMADLQAAIEAIQKVCEHDHVETGNTHNKIIYTCTKCRHQTYL